VDSRSMLATVDLATTHDLQNAHDP